MTQLLAKGTASYQKSHDLFVFLIDTGVRLSEALNATWDNINFEQEIFEVYRPKTRSLSTVPLTDRLIRILKDRQGEDVPFDRMSRSIRQLRIVIDSVCNNNERIIKQRGKATIHSLRDTAASRLVSKGMSLHMLSKFLGHTSPAMSAKYAHLANHDVVEAARAILNAR